jgi:hypothetical protein
MLNWKPRLRRRPSRRRRNLTILAGLRRGLPDQAVTGFPVREVAVAVHVELLVQPGQLNAEELVGDQRPDPVADHPQAQHAGRLGDPVRRPLGGQVGGALRAFAVPEQVDPGRVDAGRAGANRTTAAASRRICSYGSGRASWAASSVSTGPIPVTPRLLKRSTAYPRRTTAWAIGTKVEPAPTGCG